MLREIFLIPAVIFSLAAVAQNTSVADNDVVRTVNTDESGVTIETRILLEKAQEQGKITFSQETENGFIFKKVNWAGEVVLQLENGAVIRLEDSNIKTQTMQPGAYIGSYYIPNRYERTASYLLNAEECALLRQSSIKRVEYSLDDKFDKQERYLDFSDQRHLLKAQMIALGL